MMNNLDIDQDSYDTGLADTITEPELQPMALSMKQRFYYRQLQIVFKRLHFIWASLPNHNSRNYSKEKKASLQQTIARKIRTINTITYLLF